jgi:hypothetical protein
MKAPGPFLFGATLFSAWLWAGEVLAYTDFGKGRPITTADLSGKTFCWDDGGRVTYGANGKLSSNFGVHDRPWSVPEPGVFKGGRGYDQMEVLPDGRLHIYKYCLLCDDHDLDHWATPCN